MSYQNRKDSEAVILRAHHLLCFHAYSGKGYSREFIDRMDHLRELFLKHPETRVMIIASPDSVCEKCPNLSIRGCIADGTDDQEERVQKRDRAVLHLAGIKEGEILSIQDAFKRVETSISGDMLNDICKECSWLGNSQCRRMVSVDFWQHVE
jgi:hypothetical protein